MMNIPDQFKIKKTISQNTYLVDGVLKPWNGETADVYSTISSTDTYKPTLLGHIKGNGHIHVLSTFVRTHTYTRAHAPMKARKQEHQHTRTGEHIYIHIAVGWDAMRTSQYQWYAV